MAKKICIVVGSRANYSSIKATMQAVKDHPDLELQVVATASAVLDRYGNVVKLMKADGFKIDAALHILIEGETPLTMAKSVGTGLMELPTVFDNLKPDIVVTVGDRYETLSTTIAAALMNIPLAHTMGGEVTGTIDESIRHAITKMAHIHFAASEDAKERIIKLGEDPAFVFNVGCPRMDLVREVIDHIDNVDLSPLKLGVGSDIDVTKPFVVVSQHPVTTEYGDGERQITETLKAVKAIGMQSLVLWPNSDAGADDIARGMRKWREQGLDENMHFYKNLPTDIYIYLMKNTACLIGNSSSGVREGAFIGTPVVNIGSRQDSRERGQNVIDVETDSVAIEAAIRKQVEHGHYALDQIYGDGHAGENIAKILSELGDIPVQKTICY